MSNEIPVKMPGGFAPAMALGQTDANGNLVLIGPDNPLSVTGASGGGGGAAPSPAPAALEGDASADTVAGPFDPASNRPVYLQLAGVWDGTVTLKRSTDGGATLHPLTIAGSAWGYYSANICEPVWEENEAGAQLYLDIALTSGTLSYRVSQ